MASLEWPDFVSYVEVENLLPKQFLLENALVTEKRSQGGPYLKMKKEKKSILWKKLFDLPIDGFQNFDPLFNRIMELYKI